MKNKSLKKDDSPNLLIEIIKCSHSREDLHFIDNLLENFNLFKKDKIMTKNDEEYEAAEDINKLYSKDVGTGDMLPLTNLIQKNVIQRNQKNLCDNCRRREKRKSMIVDTLQPNLELLKQKSSSIDNKRKL